MFIKVPRMQVIEGWVTGGRLALTNGASGQARFCFRRGLLQERPPVVGTYILG